MQYKEGEKKEREKILWKLRYFVRESKLRYSVRVQNYGIFLRIPITQKENTKRGPIYHYTKMYER